MREVTGAADPMLPRCSRQPRSGMRDRKAAIDIMDLLGPLLPEIRS